MRANAPTLRIIASDSASRPGSLAVVNSMFAYSDGPKFPNTNARSKACAAPKISLNGAARRRRTRRR